MRYNYSILLLYIFTICISCAPSEFKERNDEDITDNPRFRIEDLRPKLEKDKEAFRNYIRALLLLDSKNQSDWQLAKDIIDGLDFNISSEESSLVARITDPTKEGDKARSELYNRARIHELTFTFSDGYDPAGWERAFNSIKSFGYDGKVILAQLLLSLLGLPQTSDYWDEIRFYLLQMEDVTGEILTIYVEIMIEKIPGDEKLYIVPDKLVQLVGCLVSTGADGAERVYDIYFSNDGIHVKRVCIMAFAEVQDTVRGFNLIKNALDSSSELLHQTAIESLSKYTFFRDKVVKFIREEVNKDTHENCRKSMYNVISGLRLTDCIDILIHDLDNRWLMQTVITQLKKTTGLFFESADEWREWYNEKKE